MIAMAQFYYGPCAPADIGWRHTSCDVLIAHIEIQLLEFGYQEGKGSQ
jgi:hypothetical protein